MQSSGDKSGWDRFSVDSRGAATTSNACLPGSWGSLGAGAAEDDGDDEGTWWRERSRQRPGGAGEVISLRDWIDRPGRPVEMVECLHIFQQVAEAVSVAHSQVVAMVNVRPSCFVMTRFHRVSFIESASCSSSGSHSFGDAAAAWEAGCLHSISGEKYNVGGAGVAELSRRKEVAMRHTLSTEFGWYTSPEEAGGAPSSFTSDVYRLGVLLFELFCMFDTVDDKCRTMTNLRHRVLPPKMLLNWPTVASFCLWLLHPQPNSRPKVSEILQSDFLNERRGSLEERESALKLREEIEDQELMLEFLSQSQKRKDDHGKKLHEAICFLNDDIDEVVKQLSLLKKKGGSHSRLECDEHSPDAKEVDELLIYPIISKDSTDQGTRKRLKPELLDCEDTELCETSSEPRREEMHDEQLSRGSRLMLNFKKLEAAYFSTRGRFTKSANKFAKKKFLSVSSSSKGSTIQSESSSIHDIASMEGHTAGSTSDWVNPFLEGLCKYLSYSKLRVRADLRQGDLLNSSSLICSLGFDRDREFFATAGVNKKIKVFECEAILNEDHDIHYPVVEMISRSKLSSICWNSYIKSQIASSDFEGVVQVWDATQSQVFLEMREHEKRIWSVDFSSADPKMLASGGDDGAVKLWNINQTASIGTIRTKANVCSVQFLPDSARSFAIGSADHNVYFYDLRNLRIPWCTLGGHAKTVSYVKFVDRSTLVSASTDNSLKLWDLSTSSSKVLDTPLQTFSGHTNIKNFVGLSISDGYIATGSETNEVFVYHKAFPMPVLSYKFGGLSDRSSAHEFGDGPQFISCVCWRGQSSTLVAANSSGNIKLLEMV